MKHCLITFRSVTPAQKAERLLRQEGFSCALSRTPRWMEEQGCGYSLRIQSADASACVSRLRQAGITFRKVYLQRSDGKAEELEL